MKCRTGIIGGGALVLFLGLSVVARADTISYADAVTTLAKACGEDIKKVCSGLNLGDNAISNCLQKNVAKVSPTCTSTLAEVTASIKQRQAAQSAYYTVCKRNMTITCKGVKGDGRIISKVAESEYGPGYKT